MGEYGNGSLSGEENMHKTEQKETASGIKLPLAYQQVKILKNALPEDVEVNTVVESIEELVKKTAPESLYQEVYNLLSPLVCDRIKLVLGMLFMYKKKPCREGNYCTKGPRCIFLHDKDLQKSHGPEIRLEKMKRRLDSGEVQNKRQVLRQNHEVVFNKIPPDLSDEALVLGYAKRYGGVEEIKKLNEGKYLIRFETHEAARSLVDSQESVLNHPGITKFFNIIPGKQEESLDALFSAQQEVLNSIYRFCSNKELFSRLKYLCVKIQKKVEEGLVDRTKRDREKIPGGNSLYANQFK